jgi:hypothetical protein
MAAGSASTKLSGLGDLKRRYSHIQQQLLVIMKLPMAVEAVSTMGYINVDQ